MSNVFNLVVDHKTISEDAREELDNCAGHFDKAGVVQKVYERFAKIPDSVFLSQKQSITLEMAERAVNAEIKKKVRLRFIDSNGQVDYLAFNERLIALGEGNYVHRKDANIFDISKRRDNQDENIRKVVDAEKSEREAEQPVVDYMIKHDVERFEDACKLLGFV